MSSKKKDKGRAATGVTSLVRGLRILETFARQGYGLTLAQVAREMDLPKSTTHRLLATLTAQGYLYQPLKGGPYFLAPPVLGLGFAALKGLSIREAALPYLEGLFEQLQENINLCVMAGREIIYIARYARREVLSLNLQVGSRLPVYNSSPGRVLAAYLPPEEAKRLSEELAANTEADSWLRERGIVWDQLMEQVRGMGYAINDGEYLPELFALAAPVWEGERGVRAAVSLALLKRGRSREELLAWLKEPVLECAARVSMVLGHGRGKS